MYRHFHLKFSTFHQNIGCSFCVDFAVGLVYVNLYRKICFILLWAHSLLHSHGSKTVCLLNGWNFIVAMKIYLVFALKNDFVRQKFVLKILKLFPPDELNDLSIYFAIYWAYLCTTQTCLISWVQYRPKLTSFSEICDGKLNSFQRIA